MMEVFLLGTGTSQGVPVIGCHCKVCQSSDQNDKRTRTSALVKTDGKSILIDCGPDFRFQMLSQKHEEVDAVILTHEHQDHIAGLDDLRAINFKTKKPLNIYCSVRVAGELKRRFSYAFADEKYPGAPNLQIKTINPGEPFDCEGVKILPFEVTHGHWPVLGFKIKDFVYITDANQIGEESVNLIGKPKMMVVNALQLTHHYSHFTLEEAQAFGRRVGSEQVVFTHISHKMGLASDVSQKLEKNEILGFDGATFKLY